MHTTSETAGLSKRLEAIQIKLVKKGGAALGSEKTPYVDKNGAKDVYVDGTPGLWLDYGAHVQGYGWQYNNYELDDDISSFGTVGEGRRLEAIRLNLVGFGESAGTAGLSKRLEAIQIVIVPKGTHAPGPTARPFIQG